MLTMVALLKAHIGMGVSFHMGNCILDFGGVSDEAILQDVGDDCFLILKDGEVNAYPISTLSYINCLQEYPRKQEGQ